jgi:hypothetical protein
MTKIEATTRNGQSAIKVTCTCKTHAADANSAVITGPAAPAIAARKGADQAERIHGYVTMANHPARMMRIANERSGVYAS